MKKPYVAILKTDGINCDNETVYAFNKLGAIVDVILFNTLKSKKCTLDKYTMLVIPGGFSYGDDIASGKIFALELMTIQDQIDLFIKQGKLILGICNGFQVLVRAGILPFNLGVQQATLIKNNSKKFECRWITMYVEPSPCVFTQGLQGTEITLPIAHGEGKFFANQDIMDHIITQQLIPLRYTKNGLVTHDYPHNPNGSEHAIAGICDASGRIFGLMPHPERFVETYHHPLWRRESMRTIGLAMLENGVTYARSLH